MAFTFKLEETDGTAPDPSTIVLGVHTWKAGDTITLGRDRTLRVVDVRDQGDDEPVVLVVEESA